MRLLLRFAPLLVGLFVAVPAFAEITSAPQFAIDPISSGPTTESVELRTLVFQLGGTCPEAGTPQCIKTRISFRITPCPPGAACTNGGYEETYYPETSHARYFTLNRGQEYTFTGHVISDVSARPNLTCSNIIRCTFEQDVLTKKYTPSASVVPPVWDVLFDSTDGNVSWVTIKMTGLNTNNSCSQSVACSSHEIYGLIVPCPVDVEGYSGAWCSGPAGFSFHLSSQGTIHAALQVGHTYTISGSHTTVGLTAEMGNGPCAVPACTFAETTADKVVTASPVATRPITWGAVKSMYKAP